MTENTTDILNQIQNAFAEFKTANDARLAEIEKKGSADTLIEQKVDRISDAITDLEKKMNRGSVSIEEGADADHRAAWLRFARKGIDTDLAEFEAKSINVTTPGDGGYALPKTVEAGVYQALTAVSPVRALATVVQTTSQDYRILAQATNAVTGWVAETGTRAETNAPTLAEITVPTGEVYANPAVSQRALDDIGFDVEAFLAAEIAAMFAKTENAAFVTGDGTNKPKGFMAATGVQYVAGGSASAFPTTGDWVIDMTQKLAAPYRAGATWLMSAANVGAVRKYKDSTGNYLWQPSLIAGNPATLNGYSVYECEDMPTVAANALPVALANLKQGYVIADRIGIRTLRDPFSSKPYVLFYSTKRVGGEVRDKNAFVHLKIATS